jgi:hypothetical protein
VEISDTRATVPGPSATDFSSRGSTAQTVRDKTDASEIGSTVAEHPCGLKTRWLDGGLFASFEFGRLGRTTRSPPQLGQRFPNMFSAQARQKVHSNEQIIASVAAGGRSVSQHSQFGRSSSIGNSP